MGTGRSALVAGELAAGGWGVGFLRSQLSFEPSLTSRVNAESGRITCSRQGASDRDSGAFLAGTPLGRINSGRPNLMVPCYTGKVAATVANSSRHADFSFLIPAPCTSSR